MPPVPQPIIRPVCLDDKPCSTEAVSWSIFIRRLAQRSLVIFASPGTAAMLIWCRDAGRLDHCRFARSNRVGSLQPFKTQQGDHPRTEGLPPPPAPSWSPRCWAVTQGHRTPKLVPNGSMLGKCCRTRTGFRHQSE